MKIKAGKLVPQEYECQFRGRLTRSFEQPELKQKSIWYIDPGEKYLGWAFTDVENLVVTIAIPWFDRFANPEYPIQVLLNEDEDMNKLWGFGRNPCPSRHYMTGYLALNAGRLSLANFHLSQALSSSSFETIKERLRRDVQRTNNSFESDALKTTRTSS